MASKKIKCRDCGRVLAEEKFTYAKREGRYWTACKECVKVLRETGERVKPKGGTKAVAVKKTVAKKTVAKPVDLKAKAAELTEKRRARGGYSKAELAAYKAELIARFEKAAAKSKRTQK